MKKHIVNFPIFISINNIDFNNIFPLSNANMDFLYDFQFIFFINFCQKTQGMYSQLFWEMEDKITNFILFLECDKCNECLAKEDEIVRVQSTFSQNTGANIIRTLSRKYTYYNLNKC